jgi:hypothetical protein
MQPDELETVRARAARLEQVLESAVAELRALAMAEAITKAHVLRIANHLQQWRSARHVGETGSELNV